METIYFQQCTLTSLDKLFGLRQVFDSPVLSDWLNQAIELSPFRIESLQHLRELFRLNVLGWNEQKLSLLFIGPVFSLAEISSQRYNLIAQRQISSRLHGFLLTGRPDGMVASGYREPEIPYFAFQEYKKGKDPNGDPAAQALAAMVVGQALNEGKKHPLYGCYLVGENWRFLVLDGTHYAISPAYSALTDDVFAILKALVSLKNTVEKLVG